jgi:hypothetical protein
VSICEFFKKKFYFFKVSAFVHLRISPETSV